MPTGAKLDRANLAKAQWDYGSPTAATPGWLYIKRDDGSLWVRTTKTSTWVAAGGLWLRNTVGANYIYPAYTTDRVRINNGSSAAPAYSFLGTDGADTGMYYSKATGEDEVCFAAHGYKIFGISGMRTETSQVIRGATSLWYHVEQLDVFGATVGPVGGGVPDFIAPNAYTSGGWQLDNDSKCIYLSSHMLNNWDGASGVIIILEFELAAVGEVAEDTVNFTVTYYYKKAGEAATKSGTLAPGVTVGTSPQWTKFQLATWIPWNNADGAGDSIETDDQLSFVITLDTTKSEVDDVIVNTFWVAWETNKIKCEK